LIDFIIKDCKRIEINNVFALLLEINEKSVEILERFGFSQWGFMPDVANINGIICGHLIYGKNLTNE
jgi:phosphinothricin acetyltransferase